MNQRFRQFSKSTSFLPEVYPGYSTKLGLNEQLTSQNSESSIQDISSHNNAEEAVSVNNIISQDYSNVNFYNPENPTKSILKVKKGKILTTQQKIRQFQMLTRNQKFALTSANHLENQLGLKSDLDIRSIAEAEPLVPSMLFFATDEGKVKLSHDKKVHFCKDAKLADGRHITDIYCYSLVSQCFAIQNCLSLQEVNLLL